ncbi:retrovirus-related pol polyprotein from transposon TNT 1-94 [Tanacetum coccineum]
MSNQSEDIQAAGSVTRPPMLDKTDFESWQQRIRLYCTDGPYLGPERDRVVADLSQPEKDILRADIRATNILLQGSELTKDDHESQLYDEFEHFGQHKGENIHDYYVRGAVVVGNGGAQNKAGNANARQGNPIKSYNCNGIGHIARNCNQPKRPQNSNYFKEKMLLMQAQENEVDLDEEQLLFLAGGQTNTFDDDVDEGPVQDMAQNEDNIFQADQCDTFDSDVDEAPSAQTLFMANLSSAEPVYDEVGPSYDSDTLSEVQDHDNSLDNMNEYHEEHEMQNDVQPNDVVNSDTEYASNSNIIPYEQTDFASWQQRIRLYCRGKENGVNIFKSIDEGPFQMGAFRETLAEGLPKDIYSLINHYTDAKDTWDNVKMLLEGSELTKEDRESQLYDDFEHFRQHKGETIHDYYGRFVTSMKLNKGLRDSNYDQLYAYLKQYEAHANENKMMLERFTQPNVDPLALTSNVSHQLYNSQSSTNPPSTYVPPYFANNNQLDLGLSLSDNLIKNLTNILALLTQSYKTYLPQTNNQLKTSSNPRNQATVQNDRVVVQNVQG